jgi:hypothetical protein
MYVCMYVTYARLASASTVERILFVSIIHHKSESDECERSSLKRKKKRRFEEDSNYF